MQQIWVRDSTTKRGGRNGLSKRPYPQPPHAPPSAPLPTCCPPASGGCQLASVSPVPQASLITHNLDDERVVQPVALGGSARVNGDAVLGEVVEQHRVRGDRHLGGRRGKRGFRKEDLHPRCGASRDNDGAW